MHAIPWYTSIRLATAMPVKPSDENLYLKHSTLAARRRIMKTTQLPEPEVLVEIQSLNEDENLRTDEARRDVFFKAAQKGPSYSEMVLESALEGLDFTAKDHVLLVAGLSDSFEDALLMGKRVFVFLLSAWPRDNKQPASALSLAV